MPNIQDYEGRVGPVQIPETGTETTARAARLSGGFYHQAGENIGGGVATAGTAVQDVFDQHEITNLVASGAELANGMTQTYNDALKDPNNQSDPDFANKFLHEKALPAVQQWQDQFTGQKSKEMAQRFASGLLEHITEKVAADQMTIAGERAVQAGDQSANHYAAMVAADPSSIDFVMKQFKTDMDNIRDAHGLMGPEAAAKFDSYVSAKQSEFAKAAIMGASNSPGRVQAVQGMVDHLGKQGYLKPGESEWAINYVKQQVKADEADQRAARVEARQAQEDASNSQLNRYLQSTQITPDGKVIFPQDWAKGVLSDPRLKPGAKFELLNMHDRETTRDEKFVPDQATDARLMQGIWTHDTTDSDILQAVTGGKISIQRGDEMKGLMDRFSKLPNTPDMKETLAAIEKQFIPGAKQYASSAQIGGYANFLRDFTQWYSDNQGKIQPGDMDTMNPTSAISKLIQQHLPSKAQQYNAAIKAPVPPALPPALKGAKQAGYNPKTGQWWADGKLYDAAGAEVKQ